MKKIILIVIGLYLAVGAFFVFVQMKAGKNANGQGPDLNRALVVGLIWPMKLIPWKD